MPVGSYSLLHSDHPVAMRRHLLGSTLEEVVDSVFHQRPVNSPAVQVTLTNALLRPCAIALIKVTLQTLLLGLGMHLLLYDMELLLHASQAVHNWLTVSHVVQRQ